MTSTECFALGVLVFVAACVWFTLLFRSLTGLLRAMAEGRHIQLVAIAEELRGINAKLDRLR